MSPSNLPAMRRAFVNREAEWRELDPVAPDPNGPRRVLVAEAKWARCSLNARHPRVRFEVFDAGVLET